MREADGTGNADETIGRVKCLASFMGGQGAKARSIAYCDDGTTPTIKSVMSGGNTVPDVVYAVQGNVIVRNAAQNGNGVCEGVSHTINSVGRHGVAFAVDCRNLMLNEELSGTLQAKENGGQSLNYQNPVVYEPRSMLAENWAESETKNALRAGESKSAHAVVYSSGSFGTLSEGVGCLGTGTRATAEMVAVFDARGNGSGELVPTLTGDHKNRATDYTALCIGNGQLNQISMAEQSNCLDCMHDKQAILTNGKPPRKYIVRRLTPLECCRLQGFPDWWEDGVEGSDSARYKMWGNGMALPNMLHVMKGIAMAEQWAGDAREAIL